MIQKYQHTRVIKKGETCIQRVLKIIIEAPQPITRADIMAQFEPAERHTASTSVDKLMMTLRISSTGKRRFRGYYVHIRGVPTPANAPMQTGPDVVRPYRPGIMPPLDPDEYDLHSHERLAMLTR